MPKSGSQAGPQGFSWKRLLVLCPGGLCLCADGSQALGKEVLVHKYWIWALIFVCLFGFCFRVLNWASES